MKPIIALKESHDSTFVVYDFDSDQIITIDLEKISNIKHYWFWNWKHAGWVHTNKDYEDVDEEEKQQYERDTYDFNNAVLNLGLYHLEKQFGIKNDFSTFVYRVYRPKHHMFDRSIINCEKFVKVHSDEYTHHMCHAFSSFAQSNFEEAFCISWDGVGDDTSFTTAKIDKNGLLNSYQRYVYNFGFAYGYMGVKAGYVNHRTEQASDAAGKVMGLAGYGYEDEDTERIKELFKRQSFYKSSPEQILLEPEKLKRMRINNSDLTKSAYKGFISDRQEHMGELFVEEFGVSPLTYFAKITERKKANYAWAVQQSFNECIEDFINDQYDEIMSCSGNLILSGGNSLNVTTNEYLKKCFPEMNIFLGVNVNDSGLTLGLLAKYMYKKKLIAPEKRFDVRYSGMRIFDESSLNLCQLVTHHRIVDADMIAKLLQRGKIIALIQGRQEVGPRALCNRSLICDPSFPEMKRILNKKVKHREWFRPFAPVCRKEDAEIFFKSNSYENLEYMSYGLEVREEYIKKFPSITHVDGTARVQTVTEQSNKFIWDVLGKTSGVLLNTSLNVRGKPICNRFDEACELVCNSEVDYLVVENENKEFVLFDSMAFNQNE